MSLNPFSRQGKNLKEQKERERLERRESFRRTEQEALDKLTPVIDALNAYNAELGRHKPKEFWVDGSRIRVFLGNRRHDINYDVYEEIIWIDFRVSEAAYLISHHSGPRGQDKAAKTSKFTEPEPAIQYIKDACEAYFAEHAKK